MDLVITQLTDLHIKQKNDLDILMQRTSSIVGAIFEVIRNPKETMLLICVTGDIAYSGTQEQYNMAEKFFNDIYDRIINRNNNLDIQFVFVAGNHDCDFDHTANKVRNTILKSDSLDINDSCTIEYCTAIQENYFNFVDKYVEKDLASPNRKNSIFTQVNIINKQLGEYNIIIHCLNTAWCSYKHEIKNMLFSVPEGIDRKGDNDIIITLMHHGENWFDWTGLENWENYHKEFSDIILVGHDHYMQFVQKTNYDSTSNYFIKGNQLYSAEEPDQSGFNIFKVNLQDNIEFFYTYAWNGKLYERIIDSNARKFEKNRFLKSKVSLVKELKEYLEDIEIDIVSKYKSPILLSDVYVFPSLKKVKVASSDKTKVLREKENIIETIKKNNKMIIYGNKEYGKTSLLKKLFSIFYCMDLFPVFINVENIDSPSEDRINKLIRDSYKSSYINLSIDEVMQMEIEKRVCFIDDFDEVGLSDKSQKAFLENIINQFGMVILTINKNNNMIDAVKNLETNSFISNTFFELEIRPLRSYEKNRIVDKWLLLEDSEQDVNSQKFDAKRKAKLSQLQSILKNGYFSNTPIELLLVLSYVDSSEKMNADYSRYSYIYDCLIRDKINNISNQDTKAALAYRTLLEILAYDLYSNDVDLIFDEQYLLNSIANYNENYTPFKEISTKIIQKLVQYKVLEERNDKFKFKYNYMYYYFAGSYIVDILSLEEKEAKTIEILSDLSVLENYNIALFMAYSMSTEYEILPKLKKVCGELLADYKDFKYEDQRNLLEKINTDVLKRLNEIYRRQIPLNNEIPEIQKNMQIERDDKEDINDEEQDDEFKRIIEEEINPIYCDFLKLLRLIEFQGDILKNYATKIRNTPRKDIIELMGNSNLKLIGLSCSSLSDDIDKIISIVDKIVKENSQQKIPEKEILLSFIKEFISILWSDFIELNVNNLASCWECDSIQDDVIEYKEKMESEFFDMVNIEYQIKITESKLPVNDIERCLYGKRKLGSFSIEIMKNVIASYLTSYQYDSKDKERICNLLGFDYKTLYIEDQKNIKLGLE